MQSLPPEKNVGASEVFSIFLDICCSGCIYILCVIKISFPLGGITVRSFQR